MGTKGGRCADMGRTGMRRPLKCAARGGPAEAIWTGSSMRWTARARACQRGDLLQTANVRWTVVMEVEQIRITPPWLELLFCSSRILINSDDVLFCGT
ncbi:hypothetical protein PR202_gb13009 [Eleusine coracana subsp. coracana]|uniref:Uncharacterized protein n=1 Tax=Eleusine coracana subsp. coracana TaxID=191504 RepID=A0AAV5ESL9_ELECO|nr:hypothetical protein PR202_gb13009 [Eleusine coracana subsp. coracana]